MCFFKFGGESKTTISKCRDLFRNVRFANKRAGTVQGRQNVHFLFVCRGRLSLRMTLLEA